MSDRYQAMFDRLSKNDQGAFVPFLMLGDPDKQTSIELLQQLIDSGADALELGIPFSDPVADGPTIQAAAIRALENGITPNDCFDIISTVRKDNPHVPVGLLLYSNLVVSKGIDNFYRKCADAGVDSVLIADVPLRESSPFVKSAKAHGIAPIFIATPNACDHTLDNLATQCKGYTYLLSRAGVTGSEVAAEMPPEAMLEKLNQRQAPPSLLGFGISDPEQVKQALESGAAGAISGSAVVKIVESNLSDKAQMLERLGVFVKNMKGATL